MPPLAHEMQIVEDLATGLYWVEERLILTGDEPYRPCSHPGTRDDAEQALGRLLLVTVEGRLPAPESDDDRCD